MNAAPIALPPASSPSPLTVRVTGAERATLLEIAQARNAKPKGARDRKITRLKDGVTIHLEGLLGEYATAKALGLELDLRILAGGDGGSDLALPHALGSLSVKYRSVVGWAFALSSTRLSEFKAAYGVLCWPSPVLDLDSGGAHVIVAGYFSADEFARHARIENYGHGNRLAYPPHALKPITELALLVNGARAAHALAQWRAA